MKYAVAFTAHNSTTTGIILDIIEADSLESAIGKFINAKQNKDILFGAYRVMQITE